VKLDFDASLFARQVAKSAAGETLYEISALSASLELANSPLLREGLLAFTRWLDLDSAKHETGNGGVFDRRVGRDGLRGRQLVELLDTLTVAISVAPPSTPVVDAIALHALQQLPAPGVCASQLFLMILLRQRLIRLRRGFLIDYARNLTQVVLMCENELFVVVLRFVGFEWDCVQVGVGRMVGTIFLVQFLLGLQARNMTFREVDRELQGDQLLCLDGRGGGGGFVPEGKRGHHLAR
jgi:hypothetical protein